MRESIDRPHRPAAQEPKEEAALRAIVADIVDEIECPGFRGCPFINAAAEFPEPSTRCARSSRRTATGTPTCSPASCASLGHPRPGDAADEFVLARDGAMSGGYAGDPVAATTALVRATDRVLAEVK